MNRSPNQPFTVRGGHTVAFTVALLLLLSAGTTEAATPTLVQHVASAMDQNPVTSLTVRLPNPAGAGNCLILGVRFNSNGTVASVADDQGNTWIPGPTVTNSTTGAAASTTMSLFYALNVAPGTQRITVTFAGLSAQGGFVQAVLSEFYNVATAAASDGSSAAAASRTVGNIATTTAGDLVYHWG